MRLTIMLLLLAAATSSSAQCSGISVNGPSGITSSPHYRATVSGHESDPTISYHWTVSEGQIVKGQGTPEIDIVDAMHNSLTVTVEIGGLPKECPKTASETSSWDPAPQAVLLDEFPSTKAMTQVRLSRLRSEIVKDKSAQLYVIIYAPNASAVRKFRWNFYRNFSGGIMDAERGTRVTIVEASPSKGSKLAVWLVPAGASPPRPS